MTKRDPQPVVVVLTTFGTVGDARAFVRRGVESGVIACGTILPDATSLYRWKGEFTETSECVALLKAPAASWPRLVELAQEMHPYDVPELLALPVEHGLPAYLDWLRAETTERKETPA